MTITVHIAAIETELATAEAKAWDALGRYKFWMFGYFAARWVYLNRLANLKRPNPFKDLVALARTRRAPAAPARLKEAA